MRSLFFSLIGLLPFLSAPAQSFKKYPLDNSGCNYYSFCEIKFNPSKSIDSSAIWTGECVKEDINYGVICVKLLNPITELPLAEDMMISYADYLKTSFEITKSAGYGRGHLLNNNENTRGIIDYWSDPQKNNWKIKGWTDGKYIGFLYVYAKKELPEPKVNLFLDGFRLPGM
ncbi:MAG: hypothetical protein HYZ15_11830 [Sphingobacteriales bacterium]|nr:hypothetical protein [Sphingobacteriales bacterium]